MKGFPQNWTIHRMENGDLMVDLDILTHGLDPNEVWASMIDETMDEIANYDVKGRIQKGDGINSLIKVLKDCAAGDRENAKDSWWLRVED